MVNPPLNNRIYHCHTTTNISTSKYIILQGNIQYEVVYVHDLRLQAVTGLGFFTPQGNSPEGKASIFTGTFLDSRKHGKLWKFLDYRQLLSIDQSRRKR